MNSSAQDIAYLLGNDSSLSYAAGVDLFWARMPPAPQDCVTVMDRAGDPPMLQYNKDRSSYYHTAITVYIRNIDYAIGYAEALVLNKYLHGIAHTVISGTYYSLIKAIGEPRLLHYDQNDRPVFIINFKIQRRENS